MKKKYFDLQVFALALIMTYALLSCNRQVPVTTDDLNITNSDLLLKQLKKGGEPLLFNKECYDSLMTALEHHANPGIILYDLEGRLIKANESFLQMLDFTPEDLKTRNYQDISPIIWREMEFELFQKTLRTGYSGQYKKEYICNDSTIIPATFQTWLLLDADRKPHRLLGMANKISHP